MRNNLEIYDKLSDQWWRPEESGFRSLHEVNEFRFALLKEWLGDFAGKRVVDLGCGGGLLSEKLAHQGAEVVGVDLSLPSLAAAVRHRPPQITCVYVHGEIQQAPLRTGSADLVLLADVIEHIVDYPQALAESARIVRSGGHVYINTLNRTFTSRLFAVWMAEGMGLIPRGTHDPRLLVRPDDLERQGDRVGLRMLRLQGETPSVWRTLQHRAVHLKKASHCQIAYSALLLKRG